MAVALRELVDPAHTAVVISEMQRGIVGDLARPPMLEMQQAVAEHGVVPAIARLADAARASGSRVVHATLQFRADRAGVRIVTPLMAVTMKDPDYLLVGSAEAEIVPELGPDPRDIVAARIHGMSAFTGTELDPILRSLDIKTLVVAGISLNEAVIGMAIEAVNIGYRVVIPRDAVMGLPETFAADMLRYAFALLGRVVSVDEVIDCWTSA
ncbi:MAG TPA: cysteine hydrolase family protein [Mycobacteriales bacterium]|jgi:nicotinamidase-related amidase|nr:cysteine hydrolase family protein [Mycobacteriales bacterium]